MFNPVNREKLVEKLENHPRSENLNSLKIKKWNPEIWSEMLQSKARSKDLKTQDAGLHFKSSRSNLESP